LRKPALSELWVVNASPIITLAKAGCLHLLEQLASVVVPEAVVQEIEAGPNTDPARKALEGGWGARSAPLEIPGAVLEWGLGAGESAVLALALEESGRIAVLDDAAARRCARSLGVMTLGTLAVVLRAKQAGLIPSASQVAAALLEAGLRLDDETLRTALERGAGERWPPNS
jgi:predicted nucleic acid-binding protein